MEESHSAALTVIWAKDEVRGVCVAIWLATFRFSVSTDYENKEMFNVEHQSSAEGACTWPLFQRLGS